MLHLPRGIQRYAVACAAEFVTEGDVFNAGFAVCFIEAADLPKHLRIANSAGRPKGFRLATGVLMRKMVKKVPVAGNQSQSSRPVVVGSKSRDRLRLCSQSLQRPRDMVGSDHHIRVEKGDPTTTRTGGSSIPRRGDTRSTGDFHEMKSQDLGDLPNPGTLTINGHNHFQGRRIQTSNGGEAFTEHRPVPVGGDNNTHGRWGVKSGSHLRAQP